MIWNILSNYVILVICVAGFRGGGNTIFILPVLQIALSCFHFIRNEKWQSVLMLEVHLLIATAAGIILDGFLYLKFVYYDVEGVIVIMAMLMVGAIFVVILGIVTTLLKWIVQRMRKK